MPYNDILYVTIVCYAMLCYTILYYTRLYHTIIYYIVDCHVSVERMWIRMLTRSGSPKDIADMYVNSEVTNRRACEDIADWRWIIHRK